MARPLLTTTETGLTFRVKATPKASTTGIIGIVETPDGLALSVRVKVPPDKGKANAAIIKALAEYLSLPNSALTIKAGAQSRFKKIKIVCSNEEVKRIEKVLSAS